MNDSKGIRIATALVALFGVPTTQNEEVQTLPEITVTGSAATDIGYKADTATTATKTDTPIFDLPVCIQVIPRAVMEDRQVILLQDALQTVSSVVPFAGGGSAFDSPRIRGFEANTVYRDGFRGRFVGNYIQGTAHLERVEVHKGPTSVLYGRMEPGGLINQVSKQPLATLIIPCSTLAFYHLCSIAARLAVTPRGERAFSISSLARLSTVAPPKPKQ